MRGELIQCPAELICPASWQLSINDRLGGAHRNSAEGRLLGDGEGRGRRLAGPWHPINIAGGLIHNQPSVR